MRKLLFISSIIPLFLLAVLGVISFFISEKTVIENKPEPCFDLSDLEENKGPSFLNLFEEIKEKFISAQVDFLEANLAEMKIRIYREGSLLEEVPILTKGDSQSWGGTAVGLYEVISGGRASFSVSAEAYMPYALHFYGKYYLHGEPYYPWGEKIVSRFSGGCLRLKNKDAKTVFELTEIGMPVW